jgi:hypothetical protein
MSNEEKGPNGWYIGVSSPIEKNGMTGGDKERRNLLKERLHSEERLGKGNDTQYFPWGTSVDMDWDSLSALHKENQEKGGDVTSHFVNRFIEIAKVAVPIIDEFETDSKA